MKNLIHFRRVDLLTCQLVSVDVIIHNIVVDKGIEHVGRIDIGHRPKWGLLVFCEYATVSVSFNTRDHKTYLQGCSCCLKKGGLHMCKEGLVRLHTIQKGTLGALSCLCP
jgi:hypothetical protein